MVDDGIEELRDRLATLSGPARTPVLHQLGQALAMRYWRIGPGSPAGRADLDAAIEAMAESARRIDRQDTLRGPVLGQLGWLTGLRYVAHGDVEEDRETAIGLLEEALAFALPPTLRDSGRLVLGQLYLRRLTQDLRSPSMLMGALRGGDRASSGLAAGRAADCFRQVLRDGPASAEMAEVAGTLLDIAEAFRSLTGSGRFDPTRMMQAMKGLQAMQDRIRGAAATGAPDLSIFEADDLAARDPLDRPVVVTYGPEPAATGVPRRDRPAPVSPDLAVLRRELHDLVARRAELHVALSWRLRPDVPLPAAALVDEWVGLATVIGHAGGATVSDGLLLAAGFYLRSRLSAGGDIGADDDPRAAGEVLLSVADELPAESPGVISVAVELAGLLDRVEPAGRVSARLARVRPGPSGRARPLTADPVFVANPRGDLEYTTVDALIVRRQFYPRSVGLGRTVENVHGAGTPSEVLARLDASLLYLGCEVTGDGALRLSGPAELTPVSIAGRSRPDPATGGLAVLPSIGPGFEPLAEALLAAGFTGVIGWRRPVPQGVASLALFVLHDRLLRDPDPATAVGQVRNWLADPDRVPPADLPAGYAATLAYGDLAGPAVGPALVHRGA